MANYETEQLRRGQARFEAPKVLVTNTQHTLAMYVFVDTLSNIANVIIPIIHIFKRMICIKDFENVIAIIRLERKYKFAFDHNTTT